MSIMSHEKFIEQVATITKTMLKDQEFSMLRITLCEFEKLIDTYGEATCEQLLKMLITKLSQSLSSSDVMTQLNDRELEVFLGHCSPGYALNLSRLLRNQFQQFSLRWNSSYIKKVDADIRLMIFNQSNGEKVFKFVSQNFDENYQTKAGRIELMHANATSEVGV